jgi:hypothetical protein
MNRAWSFLNGAGGAFVLAVVIFGLVSKATEERVGCLAQRT